MALDDFVTRFADVDICHVTSSCTDNELAWHESNVDDDEADDTVTKWHIHRIED